METFSPFSNLAPWHWDQPNLQVLGSERKPISAI